MNQQTCMSTAELDSMIPVQRSSKNICRFNSVATYFGWQNKLNKCYRLLTHVAVQGSGWPHIVLQYYHIICVKSVQKNLHNKRKEYGHPTDWDPYQVGMLGSLVPNYRYILHLKFIMFMQVGRFEMSLISGIHNNVWAHKPK